MKLVAVILTLNEQKHLQRCLLSLEKIASKVVIDSGSVDDTVNIAKANGALFIQHPFVNQAAQFNWALTQLDKDTDWVLRIDADEYLTSELADEIRTRLPELSSEIEGVFLNRKMTFQGQIMRFGGLFQVQVLRLFRYGHGSCENRWMDEHIKVAGATVCFEGDLIDDNQNSLTWWTEKHNRYASREAVDLLNLEYGFMLQDTVANLQDGSQVGVKRWLKEKVYAHLPRGTRALLYFLYRYVLRLGFLDGRVGFSYHFLQGFWYRYLVDAKVAEVKRYMRDEGVDVLTAIDRVLDIRITQVHI